MIFCKETIAHFLFITSHLVVKADTVDRLKIRGYLEVDKMPKNTFFWLFIFKLWISSFKNHTENPHRLLAKTDFFLQCCVLSLTLPPLLCHPQPPTFPLFPLICLGLMNYLLVSCRYCASLTPNT